MSSVSKIVYPPEIHVYDFDIWKSVNEKWIEVTWGFETHEKFMYDKLLRNKIYIEWLQR